MSYGERLKENTPRSHRKNNVIGSNRTLIAYQMQSKPGNQAGVLFYHFSFAEEDKITKKKKRK
jgi:hypothetical protein